MRLNFEIQYVDGEAVTAQAVVADFIAYERGTGRKSSQFHEGIGMEDMAYVAWASLKRTGHTDKSFEEWFLTLADLEVAEQAPKATEKAVSKDS